MNATTRSTRSQAVDRLKADYIGRLAELIGQPSFGRPKSWQAVVGTTAPRQIALVVLWCVLRPRPEDDNEAPSRQQVSREIALALGMDRTVGDQQLVGVGIGLLDLAHRAGLIEPITRSRSVKGELRAPARVTLTPDAEARLEDYIDSLATLEVPLPDDPLHEPPKEPVQIVRNRRGLIEPPEPSLAFAAALDHIRRTPWRVNEFILKTMASRLNSGQWRYLLADLRGDGWHSQVKRKDRLLAIATATRFRGKPFFLDVHCDFRGRIYQRGALRYTGADHTVQALIEFADGALVSDGAPNFGAQHLAAYIAYQWGAKGSLPNAEQWTLDNEATLLTAASDPHKNKRWWKLPEKTRWHALAGADAWRRYREGLPVHLPCSWDASCSGLQIYALLMRDKSLADMVGIGPESRGRYYDVVAEQCGAKREAAKAVSMPLLYSARLQSSERALAELDGKGVAEAQRYRDKAKQIRAKAEELAPAFVMVRDWLERKVAPVFRKANKEIRWRTPLGFEVVMDNRIMQGEKIETWIEGPRRKRVVDGKVRWQRHPRRLRLIMQAPSDDLDHRKQRSALAANVVHSLDASILAATVSHGANYCGIESWAVAHDCFGVPANDAYKLRMNASKTAIWSVFGGSNSQSSGDWLTDLHRQFQEQVGDEIPPPPDHPRTFDGQVFMQGEYTLTP